MSYITISNTIPIIIAAIITPVVINTSLSISTMFSDSLNVYIKLSIAYMYIIAVMIIPSGAYIKEIIKFIVIPIVNNINVLFVIDSVSEYFFSFFNSFAIMYNISAITAITIAYIRICLKNA